MSSALVCWKSLHWPQECHSISKKLSLLIRDQMAAGGLSSYFQQAPRRCGLLIPSLEASLNHVTDDTPGLGNLIFFFFFFLDCSLSSVSLITSLFFLSDSSRCRPDAGLRTYLCIPSPSQTDQLCTSQHLSYIWRRQYLHSTGDAAFLSVCVRAAVWVCVLEAPRDNPEMSSHTSLGSNSGSSAQCGCASILHSPRQNTKNNITLCIVSAGLLLC